MEITGQKSSAGRGGEHTGHKVKFASSKDGTLRNWLKFVHYIWCVEKVMISNDRAPFAGKDSAPCDRQAYPFQTP